LRQQQNRAAGQECLKGAAEQGHKIHTGAKVTDLGLEQSRERADSSYWYSRTGLVYVAVQGGRQQ